MTTALVEQYVEDFERGGRKATKRAYLEAPCAGSDCQVKEKLKWTCFKCETIIEWGFDDHFYCEYGSGHKPDCNFRCSGNFHEPDFDSLDEKLMKKVLSDLRPF